MTRTIWQRVDPTRLGSLAITAALVGVLAGIAGATFASVAGEPAVDAAITIEEANAAANPEPAGHGGHAEEASVSRSDQRGVGLFGAYALTGAAFGAVLAVTAHALRRGQPDSTRRILTAGVLLAGALTLAPWFKYPPNPPAVGDPSTLSERQSLYVAVIVIAAIVGVVATILSRRLRAATWPDHRRLVAVGAAAVVPMLTAYALLPPAPDPVLVPATLVWRFRLASLGSTLTTWAVLVLGVCWVIAEARRARATVEPASPSAVAVSA